MKIRSVSVALVALALVGAACSSKEPTGQTDGESKKQSFTVQVDAHKKGGDFGFYMSKYFPAALKVHPGDTVTFKTNFSGEPHSVTFGTIVDAGAAKLDPAAEDEPEEWKQIPSMLPEGPGDANQMAVNPCFLETGPPPTDTACEKKDQPAFDGKSAVYSSGFLPEGSTFTVDFASDVAPGTYNYFCALHRGIMTGTVSVVAASVEIPTPAEATQEGDKTIAEITTKLAGAYAQSKNGMGPGSIFAGSGDPTLIESGTDAGITEFLPKTATAKVGDLVKFLVIGAHTVSFNVPQDAVELVVKGPDGSWHLNPKAGGPSQSPPQGPGEEGKPNVVDAGTWNGEGFLSSGVFLGFGPPGSNVWQVKFGKAGTYEYRCLVHPDMQASITVA